MYFKPINGLTDVDGKIDDRGSVLGDRDVADCKVDFPVNHHS